MIHPRALALAAVLAPAIAAAQPPAPALAAPGAPGATRLDIVAEGTATRVPDIAELDAGVVTQGASAAAAMAANARQMAATHAALRAAGVVDRDVRTAAVSLQPQYRYGENVPPVITGYQASGTLAVRFRDIARAGVILDAMVAAGTNQINGPTLSVDDAEAARDEARTAAIATARARAEVYARAAGLHVARILVISEGGSEAPSPPMPIMAMRMAKAPATEIAPGEQRLTVTLNVSFELR